MNKKKNILFTATFPAPFIRTDLAILQKHHSVTAIQSSGVFTFFKYLRTLPHSDVTFSWFASVYSGILVMFASMLRKRSVLILGGVDVAKLPEVQYGIWNSWWRSVIVRYGITHADLVLAVDPSIKEDAMRLSRYDGNNISVVPTGHDPAQWYPGTSERKNIVLTVATCDTMTRFKIKGIDFLYSVASSMPDQQFILVGMTDEMRLSTQPPPNIEILPYLTQEQLLQYYQSAKVYFQPSMREAFGSTVCEAMLCECYPVGTMVGGIPTVIGETGALVPFHDTPAAVRSIQNAITHGHSPSARKRIIEHFSLQKREAALLNAITGPHGV